ncbi:MAG: sodium:solute symporter [Acidobacteria bacterium]|nr:sodium:solute symporter [Acidobacteriota bacterium]
MSAIDWLVLLASVVGIVGYGLYKARGGRDTRDYMLAGRSMRWWVIGLSIMATQASAITFIGTTGQGYSDGVRFVQFYFGLPIAMVVICAYAAPKFHASGVYTAYEYLEKRFDTKTRTLASLIFLIQRGLGVGLALYAPAIVLSTILGWTESTTIAAMGLLVVAYTVIGGIKAVMWTDAQQMLVMLLGIVAAFLAAWMGLPEDVGLGDALTLAGEVGKMRAVETHFDWNDRYTLWSGLIGGTFLALAYFGTDQSQVQRYLTAQSLTHSRFSLLFNAVVKVPLQFVILTTGALVFAFYLFVQPPLLFNEAAATVASQSRGPELSALEGRYGEAFDRRRQAARAYLDAPGAPSAKAFREADASLQQIRTEAGALAEQATGDAYNDTNYIFLTFVTRHLPPGLVGLIIAAVFAAAMSTISAELNSLATATVVDHYERYLRPGAGEAHYAWAARAATAFWGLYATIFAGYGDRLGSLIEAVNFVGSLFYGSMLGVFVLAFGPWKVSANGAFAGMLAGLAAVAYASVYTSITFLWFNVIGCVVAVAVGLAVGRGDARYAAD